MGGTRITMTRARGFTIATTIAALLTVIALAHTIEMTARPPTNRQGQIQQGDHDH